MADPTTGIVWFRRDLRLSDNPMLRAAAERHDRLVALFVHDPALTRPSGPNRVAFLHACVDALDESLDGLLVQRHGDPASVVAKLAAEVAASSVYAAEDFGPYGIRRDDATEAALIDAGRTLERVGSPYAVPPGTIFTKGATPYQVFTPFSRVWRSHGWDDPVQAPRSVLWLDGVVSDRRPETPKPTAADVPEPGEVGAHRLADRFLADRVDRYDHDRDRPDLDRTSRLSPHLKYGTIHPRQLLDRLGRGTGPATWATELCWRDFYADVLFHQPQSARRNYVDTMDDLRWDTGKRADERFDAWAAGRTGFPAVDAAMRQLLAEGWMHNRMRMVTASFLVKDLHVDWRRGARHFLHYLFDGDLASNNHGWQWTTGTGTDAAPFFRIFNPITQGQRFDPEGDYVRRWVPELADIEGKAVHEPWKLGGDLFSGGGATDYPEPIVDHAIERDEALARYQAR